MVSSWGPLHPVSKRLPAVSACATSCHPSCNAPSAHSACQLSCCPQRTTALAGRVKPSASCGGMAGRGASPPFPARGPARAEPKARERAVGGKPACIASPASWSVPTHPQSRVLTQQRVAHVGPLVGYAVICARHGVQNDPSFPMSLPCGSPQGVDLRLFGQPMTGFERFWRTW